MTTEIIGYRCTKGPITELSFDPKDGWDNEPISCWRGAYIFPPDEPTLLDASTPYELGFNEAIKLAAEVCIEKANSATQLNYKTACSVCCEEILALRPEPVKEQPTKRSNTMKVEIGSNRFTQVNALDDAGNGGAHHKYTVTDTNLNEVFCTLHFQDGPIGEAGVNGCHHEDLLAIVIHRLQCFQSGPYMCRENALALTKLEEAMHWLNHRTAARQNRGVEGTSAL